MMTRFLGRLRNSADRNRARRTGGSIESFLADFISDSEGGPALTHRTA
jgi:hypothetical protein